MDNAKPSSSVSVLPNKPKTRAIWNFASQHDVGRFIALVKSRPRLQTRITPLRLLPEWEKLEPITGISAHEMCMKWKRLCDKYRSELRREMGTPPDQFKPKWVHFEQMSFARETEQKRIRLLKGNQRPPAVPMKPIKDEPKTPPSSPIPKPCPTLPKRLVLKKQRPPMVMPIESIKREPQSPPTSLTETHGDVLEPASCSCTEPARTINPPREAPVRKLIPIERMPSTGRVKVLGYTKQNILEDLQDQAGRAVANRRPVHRVPITDPLVRPTPDNDYDFLMIRIHPLLALFPMEMKRFCYESVQQFIVRLSETVDQFNGKPKRPML